jgi:cytochrome c2
MRFPERAIAAPLAALIVGLAIFRRSRKEARRRSRPSGEISPQAPTTHVGSPPNIYRPRRGPLVLFIALLLASTAAYVGYGYKVRQNRRQEAIALTGGNPARGEMLLLRYGCAGCHTIPGVSRATGLVGPSLESVSRRVYIGGMLTNSPDRLAEWIVNPRAVNPKTAMPVTGISSREARDVAAFLYTLN